MCKKQEVSNYTCHTLRNFTFASLQYFLSCYKHERYIWSFLLSFIQHYLHLPFLFAVRFVVFFERLAKTLHFLKMIHGGYSRSYSNVFIIYVVVRYACKYIPSQNNIKTVVIVQNIDSKHKMLSQFPNFKIKNLSLVLFYHLKT